MANKLIPQFDADSEIFLTKADSDIELVLFIDYGSPYTRRVRDVIRRTSEKFEHLDASLAVRFVSTSDPQSQADIAISAAIAASKQDHFGAMHDALFDLGPDYSLEEVNNTAQRLGLDLDQFEADLMSSETISKIEADALSAENSSDPLHTPMLFINGLQYDGVWDDMSILEAIERPLGVQLQIASHAFFSWAASAGLVLVVATVFALLLVNFGFGDQYEHFRETMLGGYLGDVFRLEMSLEIFINDGLMAIFFLIIGIEIKREFLTGELSDLSSAAMPILAALGGMLIPAALYYLVNSGMPTAHGWGVPMATDIAFTLGILALLGDRVPTSLKVFVSALAIADDLGAILVIAIFYSHGFHLEAFYWAVAIFMAMLGMNSARIYSRTPYILLGFLLWYFTYRSGLHATLAGVLTAIAIPSRPSAKIAGAAAQTSAIFEHGMKNNHGTLGALSIQRLKEIVDRLREPGFHLQHALENWSSFLILPLFAFVNTGIVIAVSQGLFSQPEVLGTFLGLVVGKPLGIFLIVYLAAKLKIAKLSSEISWAQLLGAGCLAGVGFTMSIFIASAAFEGAQLQSVKFAVLISSAASAVLGIVILLRAAKSHRAPQNP